MNNKTIFFMVLFMLMVCSAFSQKIKTHKFIPFYYTYNTEKLANKLTNHLNNDSDKVSAIHSWIIHHIKYDVAKSTNNNYKKVSVKQVLRKRKAICTGYVDLFNELCEKANIISTAVPGYIRSNLDDLNDKLYIDKHVWNAVFIDNEWKLIDVCWDAGYVSNNKLTLIGYIVKMFSPTSPITYKFKPHFVKYPTNFYYLKSGYYFKTDHIAAIPLWQLLDTIQPIEYFEKDSSFYLNKYDKELNTSNTKLNQQRLKFANNNIFENTINNGFETFHFNGKNHIQIGNSYHLIAQYLLTPDGSDGFTKKELRDSIFDLIDSSNYHINSSLLLLNIQKEDLTKNSILKRDTLKAQNQRLINSTSLVLKNLQGGNKITKSGSIAIQKTSSSAAKKLNNLLNNKRFTEIKVPSKTIVIDSINAANNLSLLKDSINNLKGAIREQIKKLDSQFESMKINAEKYAEKSDKNYQRIVHAWLMRKDNIDDLDFPIRRTKDTLLKYKFEDDLLLFDSNKIFIFTVYIKELKYYQTQINIFCSLSKAIATECCNIKKACDEYSSHLEQVYETNLTDFKNELTEYVIKLNVSKRNLSIIRNYCKNQKKRTLKEKDILTMERNIELEMYKLRNEEIKTQYKYSTTFAKLLVKLNNDVKKEVSKRK